MRTSGRYFRGGPAGGALAAVVVALDVLTKRFAEQQLRDPVELVLGAQLSLSHNRGVAFGVLSEAPDGAVIVAVLVAVAALIFGLVRGWLPASTLAIGLLAGGAVANLADRLPDGRVTDFIDLPHWPSFNIADIAITLAMLLLLLRSLRDDAPAAPAQIPARDTEQPRSVAAVPGGHSIRGSEQP